MEEPTTRYKYNCRDCSLRQECLDEKHLAPGMKLIIAQAFAQRTDTASTWDLLQSNCLMVQREQERQESALARRLRLARQADEQPAAPPSAPGEAPPPAPTVIKPRVVAAAIFAPLQPEAQPSPPPPPDVSTTTRPIAPFVETLPFVEYGLLVVRTQRLVRLPERGAIVLGRAAADIVNPPDVDLTGDSASRAALSHYHAQISGEDGQYWIEDLGSIRGTYVNDHKLAARQKVQLAPDDRLVLGECELVYARLPTWSVEPDARMPHTSFLRLTHSGQLIELPRKEAVVLGRADPTMGFAPDIDLSGAGDIVKHVSRRHVRLTLRSGWHFVQDLGSANGTRVSGKPLRYRDPPVLLRPGDQLWLGGCVVAYEWKQL